MSLETLIQSNFWKSQPEVGASPGSRVAIVHEWLTDYAGSEKVLEQLIKLFPQADVFAIVDYLGDDQRAFLQGKSVKTSFIQKLPGAKAYFRKLLWILPSAIESLDVSAYDVIISSSHAVAKGVLTGGDQLHICYCHSPIRYAWDLQHQYLQQSGLATGVKSLYARCVLHYMRLWDIRTSNGVDRFVANSRFIARRIEKIYRREALVIHPPVDLPELGPERQIENYYLTASRLVPYKRVDLIVQAFARMPDRKLVVVGDGPEMKVCRELATPNVDLLGYVNDEKLRILMAGARAFLFAAEEDFGITVVEAQACGTPVICFGKAGVLDSVIPGQTGLFFTDQEPQSIIDAVARFENIEHVFEPELIKANARRFSAAAFRESFMRMFEAEWRRHLSRLSYSSSSELPIRDPEIVPLTHA